MISHFLGPFVLSVRVEDIVRLPDGMRDTDVCRKGGLQVIFRLVFLVFRCEVIWRLELFVRRLWSWDQAAELITTIHSVLYTNLLFDDVSHFFILGLSLLLGWYKICLELIWIMAFGFLCVGLQIVLSFLRQVVFLEVLILLVFPVFVVYLILRICHYLIFCFFSTRQFIDLSVRLI